MTATLAESFLLVRGGPDDGGRIPLTGRVTTIGRAPFNDLVVDYEGVSRQHASIYREPDGFWIADLDSPNGTFVNGHRLRAEPRQLRNRDRIEVGGKKTPVQWLYMESQATSEMPR